jgi:hypothetical protein
MERSDISCLSEFDPAPFLYSKCFYNFLATKSNAKKVLDLIRANNLRSLRLPAGRQVP